MVKSPDEALAVPAPLEGEEEVQDVRSELTELVVLREQIQKLRVAEGNRVESAMRLNEPARAAVHRHYQEALEQLETKITKQVEDEVKKHPIWPWIEGIHGIGAVSIGSVIGHIDITKPDTISALWRYAGYGVRIIEHKACEGKGCAECGETGMVGARERPTKGEKLHYNVRLKTMVYRLIDIQIRLRGPYRKPYDEAKFTYSTTRSWTKMHVELAARRKAAKFFLSHLWMVWREVEGLPTRAPFIAEHSDVQHDIIGPAEFLAAYDAEKKAAENDAETAVAATAAT